jgi:hypothetical protein
MRCSMITSATDLSFGGRESNVGFFTFNAIDRSFDPRLSKFLAVSLCHQFNVRLEFLTKLNDFFWGHIVMHPFDDLVRLIENL